MFILDLSWVKIPHPSELPDWVIWMEKNLEGLFNKFWRFIREKHFACPPSKH
jgi:hypothetical protein